MISKETCVKIFHCHDEIEKAQKLINEMGESLKNDKEKNPPTFRDAFGEMRGLQLGVPSGQDAHRLFSVNPELGIKIIEQHIIDKQKRLEELMAIAKIELMAK